MHCAPNINSQDHYTCFTLEELKEIALAFNIYIQSNKLCDRKTCVPRQTINIRNKTKKQIWKSIHNRLKKICPYESCWVDLKFIKKISDPNLEEKIRYFTFKPKMSKHSDAWLSTTDINSVLQQYQELDHSFKFLGALPADFYKVIKVDYSQIPHYKRIGVVFNLDNHDQNGSHWTSFLIDNVSKTIEYFDSAGRQPNKNINGFINKIKKRLPKYTVKINNIQHQLKNSECGVYAMYFIIQRLFGYTFEDIASNIINDPEMNKFRQNGFIV
jgi:hypothetical protein